MLLQRNEPFDREKTRFPKISSRKTNNDMWLVEKSSLHRAFDEARYTSVEYQIRLGMDPNVCSRLGLTPLMRCTEIKHLQTSIKLIKILLSYGADPDLTDPNGNTLLQLAVKADNIVLAKLLLTENDINMHHQDVMGRTVLHSVAESGSIQMGTMVLNSAKRFHIDCDVPDGYGMTPLMVACANNNIEMAKLLVAQGNASVTKHDPLHHKNAYDWLFIATGIYYQYRDDNPLKSYVKYKGNANDAYESLRESRRQDLLKKILPAGHNSNNSNSLLNAEETEEKTDNKVEDINAIGDVEVEDKNSISSTHLFGNVQKKWANDEKSMALLRTLYGVYEKQLSSAYRNHVIIPVTNDEVSQVDPSANEEARGPSRTGSGGGALSKRISKVVLSTGMQELRAKTRAAANIKRSESGTDSSPNSLAASQDAQSWRKLSANSRRRLAASPGPE